MCVAFHVVHLALPEKEGSFKIRCFFRLLSISTSLASISTSLERLSISFFLLFTLFSIFVAFALFFCHRRTVITIVWHSYTTRCSFVRVKISDKAYLHYNMWCILPLAFVMIDFSLWYCFPVEWKNAMLVGFALCVWNLAAHNTSITQMRLQLFYPMPFVCALCRAPFLAFSLVLYAFMHGKYAAEQN